MKMFYDLHIHSDLSPCGEREMTPNNIVNMAKLKGLDVIAVTDHNTAANLTALQAVADHSGIKVIPGLEITSKEDVHLLAYLRNVSDAEKIGNKIYTSLPNIKINARIFGEQNIYDKEDNIIGSLDKLLLNASSYSIVEIIKMVTMINGIVIPAHVEKKAYGIIGVLGFIPPEYKFKYVEVYDKHYTNRFLEPYKRIVNSDAHRLSDISEPINCLECDDYEDFLLQLNL
ncbi:MAG: PHP domain-containing protein [Dethiosulfatibacter sp.]|nr:PHP domain-containing protein [Dethiosulfatibacter sp.]